MKQDTPLQKLTALQQKSETLLEAILASAAGYLDANISKDTVEAYSLAPEIESNLPEAFRQATALSFSTLMNYWAQPLTGKARDNFLKTNSTKYLLSLYEQGERRASTFYTLQTRSGETIPYRQVSYLYQNPTTNDVMCFNVAYDLTSEQRRQHELKKLAEELRMSRIRVFTGQIQPHFLYNALGAIQEIMLENPPLASELIGDFTTHLRGSIRAMSSDDPIPFQQELENIQAYVNIEKIRLGSKLQISYDITGRNFSVPPLTIQPLVENAIRHGIYKNGEAGGSVIVSTRETNTHWVITIQDTGIGFNPGIVLSNNQSASDDFAGITNVVFRLKTIISAAINIESVPGKGTCATVTIPKEQQE